MPRKRSAKRVAKKVSRTEKGSLGAELAPARFTLVFERLKIKNIMGEFEPELPATADASRKYCGVTKSKSWKGGSMFFAAVMAGKAYVSDRLFPPVCMSRRWEGWFFQPEATHAREIMLPLPHAG